MSTPAVDLWLADLDAAGPVPAAVLTASEKERRARIRDVEAGRRWATSRWALRTVLGRYLEIAPAMVELGAGEHGKPALAGPQPRLEFNLSHSGGLALVAVADAHPVGVDVEQLVRQRDFLALAKRELGQEVVAELESAAPEQHGPIFYAAWARHEARLKCHGGGLGGPAPGEPIAVADLDVGAGYAAALAVPGDAAPAVRPYRLDLD